MDQGYLKQLIEETNKRGGGFILSVEGKPAAVVLDINRYNELLSQATINKLEKLTTPSPFKSKILVTGGAGYIGGNVVKELLSQNYEVVVLDNLSTGRRENVHQDAKFIEGDLSDISLLKDVFNTENFYAVVHLAASIEVEESVKEPVKYFQNNVNNTLNLLEVMVEYGVKNIIFSSTAAVYGQPKNIPVKETDQPEPSNPYGFSKLVAEGVIEYFCKFLNLRAVTLRYFNAAGSDLDGKVISKHQSHLTPIILDVASGQRPAIVINGCDYNTSDGTCIRDYVHVIDIARAHISALNRIENLQGFNVYNVGTGHGFSVKEMINKASEITNHMIPMEIGPRRAGDVEVLIADTKKIRDELGFELKYSDLDTIFATSWNQVMQKVTS